MATMDKLVVELQLQAEQFKSQLRAAEGNIKELANKATSASGQVNKLEGSFKKLGGTMAAAFAGYAVFNFLKKSAEAAAEDAKSQVVLATALRNTAGASNEQIAAIDVQIGKLSMLTNVADDSLRPALAILSRTTGDSTKSMDLLNLALDVSAGTGRDVSSVALILSRAYSGNLTALNKLVPGIKNSKDWMGQLTKTFEGNAKAAANRDPLTKLNIVMQELMESVGRELLPALTDFANWFMDISPILVDLLPVVGGLVAGFVAWKVATFALEAGLAIYNGVIALSTIATEGFTIALASTGIGAIAIAVGLLTAGLLALNGQMDTASTNRTVNYTNEDTGLSTTIDLNKVDHASKVYAERYAIKRQEAIVAAMKKQGFDVLRSQFGAFADPVAQSFFSNRYDYNTVYKKAYKSHYQGLVDAAKAGTNKKVVEDSKLPKDTPQKYAPLTKFLSDTNNKITKLQADYQKKSLEMIKEYQSQLTTRIADFKAAFRDATAISLTDMWTAGANSGAALVEGLKSKLLGIKNFSQDIAKLTAAGFSSDFTQQIAAAGPIMGDQMAQAILTSTPEVQASLQDLFQQTKDASEHGVDFISESITGEFKAAADELSKALTTLATALNDSLTALGAKVTSKLSTKTASQLSLSASDISTTRSLLTKNTVNDYQYVGSRGVAGANQAAQNSNGIISNFNINTSAYTDATPETITQTIVNGIKFGLPTLVGANT